MPDDQFKVPEGVLEAFRVERRRKRQRSPRNRNESALAAALAQHHKELLGDEAVRAARYAWPRESVTSVTRRNLRVGIQAAIDSVMKGEDGG